jgi:diguanylate cyclase (GGDEF)-like protein
VTQVADNPGPTSVVRVLFVSPWSDEAARLRELLARATSQRFELAHAASLAEGLTMPEASQADALVLRIDTPEWPGLSALTQARLSSPRLPVVVLADSEDEAIALRAVQNGSRAFLVKRELTTHGLVAALGTALECQRMIQQLHSARDRAEHLATHDQLTELPNRSLFSDRLAQACYASHRGRRSLAVLFVDLDDFKSINDSLGHAVGDGLLRSLARRIAACLRESDTAARLGGDEFALLLTNLSDELDAATVARKVLADLSEPIRFQNQISSVRCSIGIATFPRDARDPEELLKKADVAMYHAKETGGGQFVFYTAEMNSAIERRQAIEEPLRSALANGDFRLHYQPQYDLNRARIIGAEALLRWQHPTLGLLQPGHFLATAEESGLIVPIGEWVLRTACAQNARWAHQGHRGLRVSVNVSSQQFLEPDFANVVRGVLDQTGLPPVSLELELTESSLLRDVNITVETLRSLKDLGVRLAIDDFGTGYSALAYLKRLPIDVLKIDQSFVRSLSTDPADATITQTIVELASGLNLTTIAEGVETFEQLLLLGSYGCKRMQGFLFGQPVPAEIFTQWLENPPFRWLQGSGAANDERSSH